MPTTLQPCLIVAAQTAADLMSAPVAAISHRASFADAVAFFIDRNVTLAPVVGDAGQPVGVLSIADLLIHVRESGPDERMATTTAARLMTPTVFSVDPGTPANRVVDDMLRSKVHHLFVCDEDGTIVGVVSACDLLRHLRRVEPDGPHVE